MYENDNSNSVKQKITLGRQLHPSTPNLSKFFLHTTPFALNIIQGQTTTVERTLDGTPVHNKRFIIIFIKTFLNGSNLYNRQRERSDYLITPLKIIIIIIKINYNSNKKL